MIGYPLDSHVSYGADGTPIWDRAVSSAALRKLTKKLFSDGVLPNPSTNLQVAAVSGVIVKILSGFALCNGCQKLQEVDLEIQLPSADAAHDRIDTVVLRLDDNDDVRACDFMVIKGVAASTPQAPTLTQSDSIWEIGLANIYRKANSTEVTNANITDTRYDASRCGIISSISQFDTTTLYQQIEADLDEFKTVNQADFLVWFENLQYQLSGDVAANLLLMINEIKEDIGSLENLKTDSKASIVDAINELKTRMDNSKVDTVTTIEQAMACTDPEKPVGVGAFKEMNNSLGGLQFGVDENGNYGYIKAGADSVTPFSKNITKEQQVVSVGALPSGMGLKGTKTVNFNFPNEVVGIESAYLCYYVGSPVSDGAIRIDSIVGNAVTIAYASLSSFGWDSITKLVVNAVGR